MRGTSSQKRTRAHTHGHAARARPHIRAATMDGGHTPAAGRPARRGVCAGVREAAVAAQPAWVLEACLPYSAVLVCPRRVSVTRSTGAACPLHDRRAVSDRGKKIVQSPARSIPRAPGACALMGSGAVARQRRAAARPLACAPPIPPPRAAVALVTRLSSRGSRHEGHCEVGRDGARARWGGCAHRFTARPLQTMRPSGHASTCLVARHTSQHNELSTRA